MYVSAFSSLSDIEAIYGKEPHLIYSANRESVFFPSCASTYSLNEKGSIFISTYLPESRVASSPESMYELEPVI